MRRLLTATFLAFALCLFALPSGAQQSVTITGPGSLTGNAVIKVQAVTVSFPTNTVLDNFNRAAEGPPPSSSWTGPLYPSDSGIAVVSNGAAATGNPASAYWNTTYGPDAEIYATGTTNFATGGLRIFVRVTNPNASNITGYSLQCRPWQATECLIQRVDNSTDSITLTSIDQTMTTGDSIGLKIVGSTLTACFKASGGSWTQIGTTTDATYATSGKIGVRTLDESNLGFDDFGGGSL
jgi:hypothetical protein